MEKRKNEVDSSPDFIVTILILLLTSFCTVSTFIMLIYCVLTHAYHVQGRLAAALHQGTPGQMTWLEVPLLRPAYCFDCE